MQPSLVPSLERLPIYVGVDASVKRDSTALVAVSFDKKTQMVRLVQHRAFTPAPGDPINFEQTVDATIIDWRNRFVLRAIGEPPRQSQASAQRLAKAGMPIKEYPQTVPKLDGGHEATYLIKSRAEALRSTLTLRCGWRCLVRLSSSYREAGGSRSSSSSTRLTLRWRCRWRAWPRCVGRGSPVTICLLPACRWLSKQAVDER